MTVIGRRVKIVGYNLLLVLPYTCSWAVECKLIAALCNCRASVLCLTYIYQSAATISGRLRLSVMLQYNQCNV